MDLLQVFTADDILYLIFAKLDPMHLFTVVGSVCKRFYNLSRDRCLWKSILGDSLSHVIWPLNDTELLYDNRQNLKALLKIQNGRQFLEKILGKKSTSHLWSNFTRELRVIHVSFTQEKQGHEC